MSLGWIALGIGILGVIAAIAASWYRSSQAADLGSVSHQWVNERRAGQRYDSQR